MTQPPITDLEKQRLIDVKEEMKQLAENDDSIHLVEVGSFDGDPFTYTKELLMSLCSAMGRPVPSDDEIWKIVNNVKKNINPQ